MDKMSYSTNLPNKDNRDLLKNISLVNSRAKIEESNGKIYVIIDGHRVEADRNDLFGLNKYNQNDWLEHLIRIYDKEMEKNKEKINLLEKQENAIKIAIKQVIKSFWTILNKFGVRSIKQISDNSKREEAINLTNQKWQLSSKKSGINNRIHSALLDNFMAACDKGKYTNQMAFNNAMLNRSC